VTTASQALARSSTVTQAVNPAIMQQQDIVRVGDLLGQVPGVTANASSSSPTSRSRRRIMRVKPSTAALCWGWIRI
jgi:hypothetical protein